jgi:hypothetical protein
MSAWNEMVFDAAEDGHIREELDLARHPPWHGG